MHKSLGKRVENVIHIINISGYICVSTLQLHFYADVLEKCVISSLIKIPLLIS